MTPPKRTGRGTVTGAVGVGSTGRLIRKRRQCVNVGGTVYCVMCVWVSDGLRG